MPTRPKSLKEVAQKASSLEAWSLALSDFLDEVTAVRRAGQIQALLDLVRDEPPFLKTRFADGETADAFSAALAEYIAQSASNSAPAWTRKPERFLGHPWFPLPQIADHPRLRAIIENETPAAFREHNVFIDENSLVRA
jgi:hypothetical protein